jgi:uncharacterized protein
LAMLSFDIRALREHAAAVDDTLPSDDPVWRESDVRPEAGVRVKGRLSAAGPERFYFHGRVTGGLSDQCRRCLGHAKGGVEEEVHLIFAEPGGPDVDDPDVYQIDGNARELDLRPAVREQWLLGAPNYLLCRADCKGLCPTCGADLNAGDCACPPRTDSKWEALRKDPGAST